MLKGLLAANIDLYVDQGDTYYKTFTLKDNTGAAIDLTNKTVSADVRKYANTSRTYPMDVLIENATAGIISLNLTPQQSNLYTSNRYVFQVKVVDSEGSYKVITGQILVEAGAASLNTTLGITGASGTGTI